MTQPRNSSPFPQDVVGAATLERMAKVPAFNRWMFDRLADWIGSRVLEIGSGLGNMSQFFIDRDQVDFLAEILTSPVQVDFGDDPVRSCHR